MGTLPDRSGETARPAAAPPPADVERNARRQVVAEALQSVGDQVVNAKTVLPWVLTSVGAPAALIGLLVPIRESGSMLPQAALAPRLQRLRLRRSVWLAGAAGQAAATAAMALVAALGSGTAAGLALLAALSVFALSRSLTSLAGKDVLGRTVPKGRRGRLHGTATALSGAAAVTLGTGIRWLGGDGVEPEVLAGLLAAAALAWLLALAVYATVREPAAQPTGASDGPGWGTRAWTLLRSDAPFRRFVTVRGLLLVSALSPPFVVALAAAEGGGGLAALGPFVVAQGVAALLGGRVFGRLADRSSRSLMVGGAAAASGVVLLFLALLAVPPVREWQPLYPAAYLVLALTHTGVRVARKTYVVDLAEGDRRTEYVAVANTAIGVLLLVTGAVSSVLAGWSSEVALAFLAGLGLLGVVVGRRLPEVSAGP